MEQWVPRVNGWQYFWHLYHRSIWLVSCLQTANSIFLLFLFLFTVDLSGDGLTLIITPDLDREPNQGENVTYRCEVQANEIYMDPVWRDQLGNVVRTESSGNKKIPNQTYWQCLYLQVLANPPIRFAEMSGDKNLYCTANITTCVLCVLCHAPSLLEDKYVITRTLVVIWKIKCVCLPYPTRPFALVGYGAQKRYIFTYSTCACGITYSIWSSNVTDITCRCKNKKIKLN